MSPQPTTLADELQEALDTFDAADDEVSESLSPVIDLLGSGRAIRLAHRRGVDGQSVADALEMLVWLRRETWKQFRGLSEAVDPLLEPPRNSRTSYGDETGIYARTPFDFTKCGTPAGYRQHRRRGQDCPLCRKAVAAYEANRRLRRACRRAAADYEANCRARRRSLPDIVNMLHDVVVTNAGRPGLTTRAPDPLERRVSEDHTWPHSTAHLDHHRG